ncbi:hypothetical protein [Gemmatimonas sp.]
MISVRLLVLLIVSCVIVAALLWRSSPAHRARSLFPLGLSAIMGSVAVRERSVWLSMLLSVLAIALMLTSAWLQRSRRDTDP